MDQSHRVCPGAVWSWRIESVDRIILLRGRGGTCDVQFHLGSVYAKGDYLVNGPQYQVYFDVSGVNHNHAVQVCDGLLVPTLVHQLRSAVEALLGVAEP